MSLQWISCCKGRKACPEVALEGNLVHIKDDYGNQVVVDRGNLPFFQKPEDIPEGDDPNRHMIRVHGRDRKKFVRMSLVQFYQLLETVDNPSQEPSEDAVVEKKISVKIAEAKKIEKVKVSKKKAGKKKKKKKGK